METSTAFRGGDLAGRSAEYRRGFWRGMDAAVGPVLMLCALVACASWVFAAWALLQNDRAEAQLAEMRAQQKQHTCIAWKMDRDVCMCQHFEPGPDRGGAITGQNIRFGEEHGTVFTTPHVEVR